MAELSERLDRLTIKVNSPDGGLTAVLRERSRLSLSFQPGRFGDYTESTLEPQLARLAAFTWVGWQRGYAAALAEAGPQAAAGSSASDEAARRSLRERFDVVATGSAVGGAVRATTRGLREWKFELEPGCLHSLGEKGSAEAVEAAVCEAVIAYEVKAEALKRGCLEPPIGPDPA